jgi:hypothetical protein
VGFGAEIDGMVSHCFPLTCDPARYKVYGQKHLEEEYLASFDKLKMSGPTQFSKFLAMFREEALRRTEEKYSYQLIIILTDG